VKYVETASCLTGMLRPIADACALHADASSTIPGKYGEV
jgi:hypothetical protein